MADYRNNLHVDLTDAGKEYRKKMSNWHAGRNEEELKGAWWNIIEDTYNSNSCVHRVRLGDVYEGPSWTAYMI